MKEKNLIPFVPIFLTVDAAMSFICLIEARILSISKKEVRWERLSKKKYYHNGTTIKINDS